jgi:hypothetical protein
MANELLKALKNGQWQLLEKAGKNYSEIDPSKFDDSAIQNYLNRISERYTPEQREEIRRKNSELKAQQSAKEKAERGPEIDERKVRQELLDAAEQRNKRYGEAKRIHEGKAANEEEKQKWAEMNRDIAQRHVVQDQDGRMVVRPEGMKEHNDALMRIKFGLPPKHMHEEAKRTIDEMRGYSKDRDANIMRLMDLKGRRGFGGKEASVSARPDMRTVSQEREDEARKILAGYGLGEAAIDMALPDIMRQLSPQEVKVSTSNPKVITRIKGDPNRIRNIAQETKQVKQDIPSSIDRRAQRLAENYNLGNVSDMAAENAKRAAQIRAAKLGESAYDAQSYVKEHVTPEGQKYTTFHSEPQQIQAPAQIPSYVAEPKAPESKVKIETDETNHAPKNYLEMPPKGSSVSHERYMSLPREHKDLLHETHGTFNKKPAGSKLTDEEYSSFPKEIKTRIHEGHAYDP